MIFILLIFALPIEVYASPDGGIPVSYVLTQIFNFSLFVLALWFLLKNKVPVFLKKQRQDFLSFRERAVSLKEENEKKRKKLQKDLQTLVEKEKNLTSSIEQALANLETELKAQEQTALKILETQNEHRLKRLKLKELNRLKNKLLFQVMNGTKTYISSPEFSEKMEELNGQVIKKWGQTC